MSAAVNTAPLPISCIATGIRSAVFAVELSPPVGDVVSCGAAVACAPEIDGNVPSNAAIVSWRTVEPFESVVFI